MELLQLGLHDPTLLREFQRLIEMVCREGKTPQRWRDAVNKVLHKNKCRDYRDILLVADEGKVLLKIFAARLGTHCGAE